MDYFEPSLAFSQQIDAGDPLAEFRDQFYFPQSPKGIQTVYLAGMSLGLQSKRVPPLIREVLSDWGKFGVSGHFEGKHPWISYHELVNGPLTQIVGALPEEVIAMNALTVNLHLMLVTFYRPNKTRYKILIEKDAFPSDRYAILSQLEFHGFDPKTALIEVPAEPENGLISPEKLLELIKQRGNEIALILLGGVNYRSGQVLPMEEITRAGQAQGCVVGFDLAHAVGNILLKLHDWQMDFAVWCHYKYLNAGPGAIGGCFIHKRHVMDVSLRRFTGWWGHNRQSRFTMPADFETMPSAEGWQLSNPPILQLAALRASLEVFTEARMERLYEKRKLLTGYLAYLLEEHLTGKLTILTPRDPEKHGCQLSLQLPERAEEHVKTLQTKGVYCDFRPPNIIRVAPVPLYNSFTDVYQFVKLLKQLL